MSDDTYNGWTNRETWALNLHLSNDQGLYEMTREAAKLAVAQYRPGDFGPPTAPDYYVGEALKNFWDELTDPDWGHLSTEAILSMVRDVGSEYRVNWDEVGAHFLED